MNFSNLKLSNQLIVLGVGVCGTFITALGIAAYSAVKIESSLKVFVEQGLARHEALTDLYSFGLQSEQALRNILLDPENPKAYENFKTAHDEFERSHKALAAVEVITGEKVSDEIARLNKINDDARNDVLQAVKARDSDKAKKILNEKETPAWRALKAILLKEGERSDKAKVDFQAQLIKSIDSGKVIVTAVSLLAVLLCIALCLMIGFSVLRKLGGEPAYAADVTNHIATGDLTMDVEVRGKNPTSLLAGMKGMQSQLHATIKQIKGASDAVTEAAADIAHGHEDLASRTEEQASSLEETAASMEEMTATVTQNAENAKKANTLAADASKIAAAGGHAVREVVGTMTAITESSKKISDIIGVIDSIAFQTNILALNAAVEAARAGEQGRGFAVVASEVRSLAQRSADAAKEIKSLIGNSVEKVEAGSRQVEVAGKMVDEIVSSVKSVTTLIAEIAAASQEQSQSIVQVNETLQQLEKVTQENAAMVQKTMSASSGLEEQAQTLTGAVSIFKLGHGED